MRTTKTVSKALTACAAISLSLSLGMGAASAIPPGGASTETRGSSTVSPHVNPGGVVNFTLSGFPPNSTVTVKIDDADRVHQQKADGTGSLSGSFVLPDSVGPGEHTLRFLAPGEAKYDANGKKLGQEKGASNKSPVFTVGDSDGGSGASNNGGGGRGSSNNSGSNKGGSSNNGGGNAEDSGNDSGSGDNGENAAQGGSADQETVYLDADGNPISKEEYDRLNSEAGDGENNGSSEQKNEQESHKAEQKNAPSAFSSAKSSASASSSAKTQADSKNAKTSNTTVTYGQEFPWLGVAVLGIAIIGAIAVVIIRKRP